MRNLQTLETPPTYFERHARVVASKKKPRQGRLECLNDPIQERFNEYERAVANQSLSTISEDPDLRQHGSDLRHCYEGKTGPLSEILKAIKDAQPGGSRKWCPYCGITKPGSFDHYLPKEKFPEFSVFAHNLVECCTNCNSTKGARWISASERLFIHFYFDQLTEEDFLFVQLKHLGGAFSAEFTIDRPANVDQSAWVVIENHFRELRLLEKYRENASDEIVQASNICTSHLKNGGSDIADFLNGLLVEDEKCFGRNHWRNVLIREVGR